MHVEENSPLWKKVEIPHIHEPLQKKSFPLELEEGLQMEKN